MLAPNKSTNLKGHAFAEIDFVKFVNGANRDWPKSQHTDTDCPAKYLENGSAEQLYPLNNIESTARALYSQPKLFFEIFDSVFEKFTSKLLKLEKFCMGKTSRLNISRTSPPNRYNH